MYQAFLSWRYLRARRTNLIGVVGIAVGVGALILILSIMTGFLEETKRTLRGGLADLVIEPWQAELPPGADPPTPAAVLELARADERVAAACAQLSWFGIVLPSGRAARRTEAVLADPQQAKLLGVQLIGIDPADEYLTSDLRASIEGATLSERYRVADVERPFAPPPGYAPQGRVLASVVVGQQFAERLRLTRGTQLTIATAVRDSADQSEPMQINTRDYVVAGCFRSGENETDLSTVYFARQELASLLGWQREYSQVLVKLKDYDRDGPRVRDELDRALAAAGLVREAGAGEVRTWEDFRRSLLGAIENERVLMAIMLSLVVMVAAFTIFAILSMMVTEKRRDIGILTALGATPRGITGLFLLIGFWDALLGATLGAILGTWGAFRIDSIEQWLSRTLGVQIFNRNVYFFDHIPSLVNPLWVAVIVLGAFVCTLLFALFPAWRAGRLHPLDALRYE